MAVVPVEKVLVVFHKSIKDSFLHKLQKEGIMHIAELKESTLKNSSTLERLNNALTQLSAYKKKEPIEIFINLKTALSLNEFEESFRSYNYTETIQELEELKKEMELCTTRLHNFIDDITLLEPWRPLNYEISLLKTFKKTEAIPTIMPVRENLEDLFKKIANIPHSFEIVNNIGLKSYYIFFVRKEEASVLRTRLIEGGGEIVQFGELAGVPSQLITSLNHRINEISKRLEELKGREIKLFKDFSKLKIVHDRIYNEHKKEELSGKLPETSSTANVIGWIKKKDIKKLKRLVEETELAVFDKIEPEPDEQPPVAIENRRWSVPYEMLIKLYGVPAPKEYDPTVFVAIFFPLFFAICLTDAIYGVFLALVSLYLMKKVPGDKSLLWILFSGALLTIFTGSMVGGWAGNLFDLIGIKPLINFKNKLMLFDPLITPMPFFIFALAIGYLHVLLGILIEVYDDIRNNEYGKAIFENLTWFVLILSLTLYFGLAKSPFIEFFIFISIVGIILFSKRVGNPKLLDQIIWSVIVFLTWIFLTQSIMAWLFKFYYKIQIPPKVYYLILSLLIVELIRFKETKKLLFRIAWGLYNLYGITSFLSFILSYIRLMALGMVTGGIALTVNLIAWMVIKIPVIGIIFGLIILIIGHSFNLVISCLGGFIHTLRLQYIEFFGRFYTGGGKPFKPFGLETKYVEIKS